MRNLFDQFEGRENRLTHALVSALGRERRLFQAFIREFVPDLQLDWKTIRIEEQSLPGEASPRHAEERKGLPDAVIWDQNGVAIAIESKLTASLTVDQLRRHTKTLRRRGFDTIRGLAITAFPQHKKLEGWSFITWIDVHRWLGPFRADLTWAKDLAHYFEVMEAQMTDKEIGNGVRLTDFSGIQFSDDLPYSYQAAKVELRSLLDAVQEDHRSIRRLGLRHDHIGRRNAITDQGMVWDYLAWPLANTNTHTGYIHYTASLHSHFATAFLTVPNGARHFWKALSNTSFDEFSEAGRTYLRSIGPLKKRAGVTPQIVLLQRRFELLPIHWTVSGEV